MEQEQDRELDIGELTPLEKEEALEARRLHRLNMTKKQKGFKGQRAFISKPAQIAFHDFTVGQPHYLVITLTNVSNAFNSFNVLPLPEKIRNYFQVEHHPKGKISPGISCDIRFKFFPQLNEDIFSQFTIVAETGRISYPIVCTFRKTILRIERPIVDFGSIILGQSKKTQLLIKNQGSLPSQFSLVNPDNSELGASNSAQQLKIINNLQLNRRGEIQGNSQKTLLFESSPPQIGPFSLQVLVVAKNGLHSPPIPITIEGQCVQVPVRVQRQNYNLQICILGHVYRQKVRFYNRSEGPVSFKMIQPPQTKKYFQFNPVIGYIQKQAPLDVWVKLTADKDLPSFLNHYATSSNLYKVPFQMNVKEQVLPVTFELQFKITSDRVTIRPPELNFGKIFQGLSSKIQVQLQNESELPQEVLLYPLKKSIKVQNDQPLFKLLPLQTLKTYIIYQSRRLQDSKTYREEDYISCRVITGQIATSKMDIHYNCEVVRPDLSISSNKVDLPALQEGEIVQAATSFKNHTNKEIIFEIFVPDFEASGLKVTPVVKTLPPKQEVEINIEYLSSFKTLNPSLLTKISQKKQPKQQQQEQVPQQAAPEKKEGKKQAKKQAKLTKQQQEQLQLQQKQREEQQRLRKQKQEQERLQMQRNFNGDAELMKLGGKLFTFGQTQHYQWLLPVYFKQKDYSDVSTEINFLQITTTSIPKVLTIDHNQLDFGQIAVGTRAVRQIVITNTGPKAQLKKKSLPIFCSFNVLNSLKEVQTGQTFKAVLQFQPIQEQRFEQRVQLFTDKYSVSCKVKGKGVRPQVQIEPQNGLVNMGGVLLEEYCQKTVKVKNICNFDIHFTLQKIGQGILNSNSGTAFSYIPSQGVVPAHGSIDVKVRFRPDRISQRFYQKIKVHIEEQKTIRYFYFSGSCFNRQAFATIYKAPAMPEDATVRVKAEYAFDSLRVRDEDTVLGPNSKAIVLQFPRLTQEKDQKSLQRKISIGSCKLLDNKMQKATAFQIILPKDDRFQCDNPKGSANAGTQTVVTFTYKPQDADPLIACIPELAGIGQWRELKGELKMTGGFAKAGITDLVTFDLILKFYVSQL